LRYGLQIGSTRGFSRKHGIMDFRPYGLVSCLGLIQAFLSYPDNLHRKTGTSVTRPHYPSPSPLASTPTRRRRNINLLSITYAFRPRLRLRLTLGGRTFPRKPWAYGGQVSHLSCRYSFRHQHSQQLHHSLPVWLRRRCNAPLPLYLAVEAAASALHLSPVTFSARLDLTSELLRFL
jgi:hypothetical protein